MDTKSEVILRSTGNGKSSSYFSPSDRLASKPSLTPTTLSPSEASEQSNRFTPTSLGIVIPKYPDYAANSGRSPRFTLPSPRRSRLDPQYAARLAPQLQSYPTTPTSASANLVPPPGITRDRNESIFRPAPIVTPSTVHSAEKTKKFLSSPREFLPQYLGTDPSQRSFSTGNDFLSLPKRRSKRQLFTSDLGTSDRFIPSRATSNFNINLWQGVNATRSSPRHSATESELTASNDSNTDRSAATPPGQDNSGDNNSNNTISPQQNLLNVLLRSELLGENLNPLSHQQSSNPNSSSRDPLREGGNHLHFRSPRQAYQSNVFEESMGPTSVVNSFSLTPVRSSAGQRLMAAPLKRKRRISKVPFKVLDAPALQDDFYLNLVDWSSQNVLAVGLGSCVYLWSACTSKVTKLCDLAETEDIVTSVNWAQRGAHLAVGTNRGEVLLWDTVKCKKIRTMADHSARVGTLAWTGAILASGSRDRLIYLRDVRVQSSKLYTDRLAAHKQEVCGLKWSHDEPAYLASGGNDNQLHVVDSRNPTQPVQRFSDHTAAVKAIAWSPHQHGLLASGGGTADRCIRFWNTLSGTSLSCVDTGSQVCNLAWSQNCNEIVSTHGYSLNQIVVWRYPSMNKVVTLTGHTYRVLYLAMSPDGSTIVTGAGDETLRFWQVFPGPRSDSKNMTGGLLFPNTIGSVVR